MSAKRAKYTDSGDRTSTGEIIYHKQTGQRGRPSRMLKKGLRYVSYKPAKVEAKVAEVA